MVAVPSAPIVTVSPAIVATPSLLLLREKDKTPDPNLETNGVSENGSSVEDLFMSAKDNCGEMGIKTVLLNSIHKLFLYINCKVLYRVKTHGSLLFNRIY